MKRKRSSPKTKRGAGISAKARPEAVAHHFPLGPSPEPLMSVQSRVSNPFNPKAAILYGQFVKAAYSMYDPATLTPPPSADFPAGYQLTAWVTMRDFILGSTDPVFYGLIAQSMTDATQFVLAIRGTSNGVEWWDDFNAAIKTPFKVPGCGSVGAGFARIYETLEVIERPTGAATAPAVARSLKPIGGFCQQVAALVRRHVAATARATAGDASGSIEITGHSLGAALATLYTLENALTDKISESGPVHVCIAFRWRLSICSGFQWARLDFVADRQCARHRAEFSTRDPRLYACQHVAALQFLRQSAAVADLLARSGYLSQSGRSDATARSGLSFVGGPCRSTKAHGGRGSRAFSRNSRHHHKLFRSERPGDDYHNAKD